MTASTLETLFVTFLRTLADGEPVEVTDLAEACGVTPEDIRDVRSFAEGGFLTRDAGLVVEAADGTRLQVTLLAR